MAVDHLARHEQVHDLGRALEDLVDAVVAHDALDRHRLLAARRERLLGLVAAPAADLHHLVDDLPRARRVPLLGGRGLEPDVVAAAVGHLGREARERLHREGVRGDLRDLVRDRLVRPRACPTARARLAQRTIPRQTLAVPTEMLGIERRPSLSVVSAIFSPLPSLPIRFAAGMRTSLKRITALASARRPMKWQRCSTVTPGQSVSTT